MRIKIRHNINKTHFHVIPTEKVTLSGFRPRDAISASFFDMRSNTGRSCVFRFDTGRLKIMLHLLFCGAAVFPGLFCSFAKVFKVTFKHWSDADVFSISERFATLT